MPADVSGQTQDREAELAARIAAGDEAAFEELLVKYQHSVLNTIHRYVGDFDAADDIAQEVFVILWNKAVTFRAESRFSTWLHRIVVTQCLQFRRKRRPADSLDELDADRPPEPLQVGDGREQRARTAAVKAAIAGLPERQRMALVLAHYEGLSYQEIAEAMDASVSTVESLIFRARESLKQVLPGPGN
jgi:RNA polymerase sigma-70 factor, ECF subfamily